VTRSRWCIAVLLALVVSGQAFATEVLVLASAATTVDGAAARNRKGFEIQNQGPNPIYCELRGVTPVVTKSRKVDAGGDWSMTASYGQTVSCRAATADQVTGAATIYTDVL
jgi:hypothetical protein